MLEGFIYYVVTAAEAALSVFGIRSFYEQPAYEVLERMGDHIEIRSYQSRLAAETEVENTDSRAAQNQAFRLLLAYIAGANRSRARLAMTAPVEQSSASSPIAMTAPVEISGEQPNRIRMRFFLPARIVAAGAPQPLDARVRIVDVPPSRLAVFSFSGLLNAQVQSERTRQLIEKIKNSGWRTEGSPFVLAYDPPFTIPFLRRNEIAVTVAPK